jgi:hypothetical protein
VSEKQPDIDPFTKANVRHRVLSDDHFEFRDGDAATPVLAQHEHKPVPQCRQARLRPEYAHIYPCLVPDIWELAAVVVEKVIAWRLQQRRGLMERAQVLDPRHFDFRDSPRPLEDARSRKAGSAG